MSDKAFISVSGVDKEKSDRLLVASSKFLYDIYYHDFSNGIDLIDQMRIKVKDCSTFIILASKDSLKSVWCNFEINLAQVESIKRGIEVYVFPIEDGIKIEDLPLWMRQRWYDVGFASEQTIVRRLSSLLRSKLAPPILQGAVERIEDANRQRLIHMQQSGSGINVFFFSGPPQIGRRTTVRGFLGKAFGNDQYQSGPEILLDGPASIEDLCLRLRSDVMPYKPGEYAIEQKWLRTQSTDQKVSFLVELLEKSQSNRETVFIICPAGLFDENGYIIEWAGMLFDRLAQKMRTQLAIISNRQPRVENIRRYPNVFCYSVVELQNDFVSALVQEITLIRNGNIHTPSPQHMIAIGGHPVLAYAYSHLLSQFDSDDRDALTGALALEQKNLMKEFLSYERLLPEEIVILSVLSWLPRIEPEPLIAILEKCGLSSPRVYVRDMVLQNLVSLSQDHYSIAGPIRFAFRQLHGFGDELVRVTIAEYFRKELQDSKTLDNESIDRAVFVVSLEGSAVPEEFKSILSASTVLKVISELYHRGKYDRGGDDLKRVIALADLAADLKAEDRILREISGVKIRSLIRLRRFEIADGLIKELESKGDRNAYILRGQFFRGKGDFTQAVASFDSAVRSGSNQDAVLHEFCICLKKTGNFKKIYQIITDHAKRVSKNAYLLDTKASLEIGRGDYPEAVKTLKLLKNHVQDNFMSVRREAILIARRDGDLEAAENLLTVGIDESFQDRSRINPDLYASRCIIRAKRGNVSGAQADLSVVRQKHLNAEQVEKRLEIYVLMSAGKYDVALESIDNLSDRTKLDDILLRDILQKMSTDTSVISSKRAVWQRG